MSKLKDILKSGSVVDELVSQVNQAKGKCAVVRTADAHEIIQKSENLTDDEKWALRNIFSYEQLTGKRK